MCNLFFENFMLFNIELKEARFVKAKADSR